MLSSTSGTGFSPRCLQRYRRTSRTNHARPSDRNLASPSCRRSRICLARRLHRFALYCDLELDGHLGIEGPDHEFGLVIKISPLYESMSPNPAWLRRTLVKYPTTLAEIYAIARRLDAEQIRVWEGEGDLGDQLGVPCD